MRPPREPDHFGVRPVVRPGETGIHDAAYLERLTAFQQAAGDGLRGHATEANALAHAATLADLGELEVYAYEPGARIP